MSVEDHSTLNSHCYPSILNDSNRFICNTLGLKFLAKPNILTFWIQIVNLLGTVKKVSLPQN